MLFFMSFTSGVLYGKLINTMKGITGAVAPLTSLPRVRSPPMKHRRPPMKFRRPRSMVPLLNLSQQLGATNPYFRATEFLGRRRNLGLQCKEATSPTTDERLFPAILIYSNFKFY